MPGDAANQTDPMASSPKPGQRVLMALRKRIAAGELKPGVRIAEIPTAAALGVSRMPVRTALRVLAEEGLVEKCGARGYAPRDLSAFNVEGAVRVRGALEGLAACQAAEQGLTPRQVKVLAGCLAEGDDLLAGVSLGPAHAERFAELNRIFHRTIIEASGNPAIEIALARVEALPFAAATAMALDLENPARELLHLRAAHAEHHLVFDALTARDPAAAQAAMSAHAMAATMNEQVFAQVARGRPQTAAAAG